jgi:hypothetical protein
LLKNVILSLILFLMVGPALARDGESGGIQARRARPSEALSWRTKKARACALNLYLRGRWPTWFQAWREKAIALPQRADIENLARQLLAPLIFTRLDLFRDPRWGEIPSDRRTLPLEWAWKLQNSQSVNAAVDGNLTLLPILERKLGNRVSLVWNELKIDRSVTDIWPKIQSHSFFVVQSDDAAGVPGDKLVVDFAWTRFFSAAARAEIIGDDPAQLVWVGSYEETVQKMVSLAPWLNENLGTSPEEVETLVRALYSLRAPRWTRTAQRR